MVDDPNKPNDSFMDEDDFLAADREFGDNDQDSAKVNLKEIWAQNPSLKIFAIVAFIAVFLIAYMVFGADDNENPAEQTSMVRQAGTVVQAPGISELPPAYEEAVRQASDQRADEAVQTGGSALPTLIQRPSERIEAPVQVEESDPLSAWRREAEMRRMEREQEPSPASNSLKNDLSPNPPPPQQAGVFPPNVQQQPVVEPPPPLPTGPTPDEVSAIAIQLQTQMQTILETQVPKESILVSMNIQPAYDMKKYFPDPEQERSNREGETVDPVTGATPFKKPIVQAGTIAYAQILTQANSDVPGPVLAEIASGPLAGGRAIGQFQVAQRHLVLRFNRVVKDGVEYPIQGFALDPGTTLPGVVTGIDHHLFQRVVLPASAAFIEGFADAATRQNNDTIITNGTVVTNTQNDLDTREEILFGVNEGARRVSQILQTYANRPITIKVAAGTRIGLLFLTSVVENQNQAGTPNNFPTQSQAAGLGGDNQTGFQNNQGFNNADGAPVYGENINPANTGYNTGGNMMQNTGAMPRSRY